MPIFMRIKRKIHSIQRLNADSWLSVCMYTHSQIVVRRSNAAVYLESALVVNLYTVQPRNKPDGIYGFFCKDQTSREIRS